VPGLLLRWWGSDLNGGGVVVTTTQYGAGVLAAWPTVGTWGEWFAGAATAVVAFVAVRQNDAERDERRRHDERRIIRNVEEALTVLVRPDTLPPERREYDLAVTLTNNGPRPFRNLIVEGTGDFGGEQRATEERRPLLPAGPPTIDLMLVFRDVPGQPERAPTFTLRLTTSEDVTLLRDAQGIYSIVSRL
jgi:hypothetical protein